MELQKLARLNKPNAYHLFDGKDTLCRMLSTGGMNPKKYGVVLIDTGLTCCSMCASVQKK